MEAWATLVVRPRRPCGWGRPADDFGQPLCLLVPGCGFTRRRSVDHSQARVWAHRLLERVVHPRGATGPRERLVCRSSP